MEDEKRHSGKVPHKNHRDRRKGRAGGSLLYHQDTKRPLGDSNKGFTFAELMMVLLMIGVALALTVPMGIEWVADYKFSAGSRAFVNAAQLVRIKSIGGPITVNVTQVGPGPDSKHIAFTVPAFTASTSITAECVAPFAEGDYITVSGVNNPDFLNGQIFLITDISSPWDFTKTQDENNNDVCSWDACTVTAKSCMENEPSNCLGWPSGLAAQTVTTGLIRVASCLRFVPYDEDDKDRVHFAVGKSGNSMECKYDPHWMDVRVLVPDQSNPDNPVQIYDVTGAKPAPIVFDYAGATRNQMTYTVKLQKMTRSGSGSTLTYTPVDDNKSPPVVFSIMPSGRVRLGSVQSYTDTD